MASLLEEKNLGLLLALVTLLLGIVSRNYEGYENCVAKVIGIMDRLKNKEVPSDYTYYQIPSPWLQVKCMRVLQYFPPPDDPSLRKALVGVLRRIITGTEVVKNLNKNNAQHAIVFEAIALALAMEADTDLLNQSVALLGKFITVREPNIKYLGLENMCRLAEVPAVIDAIHRHHKSVVSSLSDPDISIRRRALDLLFTMCNNHNVEEIVQELLDYLNVADLSMREELVLKTALLAERFLPNVRWYVDAMLTLIEKAGEFATKDVWFSVVQLITNNEELHEYATCKAVDSLKAGASHESFVCCAAYLMGEYGALLSDVPSLMQFELLHQHFPHASPESKALMLSAFVKLELIEPRSADLTTQCELLFERYSHYMDPELQQRAAEYYVLSKNPGVAKRNIQPMPKWEKRRSLLMRRLEEKEGDQDELRERPAWMQEGPEGSQGSQTLNKTLSKTLSLNANSFSAKPAQAEIDLLGVEPEIGNGIGAASPVAPHANGTAAASGAPGLTDLLDLLSDPTAAPAAVGAMPGGVGMGPPPAAVNDPFAALGDNSGLIATPNQIRPTGDVHQWFQRLCIRETGVLYEDQYLQIGLKSQFQGSQGQLVLFFGNKSAQPLMRLICAIPPVPQLAFQLNPVPPALEGNRQVQVACMITCTASFVQPPRVQIGYTVGDQQMSENLALPIVLSKLCRTPEHAVSQEVFFARWKAIPGPPMKLTDRVVRVTPLLAPAIQETLTGMHLAVQPNIDPEPANFVAVGTCTFGHPIPEQIPVMVRVEVEKQERLQFQVTVASNDVNTTSGIKELLCKLLAGSA